VDPMKKICILVLVAMLMMSGSFADDFIKKPNVSGQFYPASAAQIKTFIHEAYARAGELPADKRVEVLISPHAGYIFSGGVAAYGYKAVSSRKYSTIVLVGPSHFHSFAGASIWPKGKFETPLGLVDVDEDFAARLMKVNSDLKDHPQAFSPEHSLEVQLPFLQRDFPDAKIVPILMGNPDPTVCQRLAQSLHDLIGERTDVLVVISTDLSHYHPDRIARPMDQGTLKVIVKKDVEGFWNGIATGKMEACGFTSVVVGLLYAKIRGLDGVELLRYANSGDAIGDKERVVGYSSVIFYTSSDPAAGEDSLNAAQRKRLVDIARGTVESYIKTGKRPDFKDSDARLNQVQGAFVTINKQGALRGCIGNIIGDKALYLTVRDMAIAAASEDPRFPKVTADELKDIEVEVSVLSVPRKITDPEKNIKLGTHGVIISRGMFNRGVFLPQVATETGWDLNRFMGELCSQKAGLPWDCWKDPKTTVEVFTAEVFSEKHL
jgi:AmmeMemoRadiSam system protein B/AmmeMemoRadiSam system protein A